MNDKQTTPSLDQALNSARTSVEEQRLNAGNVSTHQPRRKQIKNILAIVLCVVCAALLFHRLQNIPQINEWPDVSSNPIIVRASLASIVEDAENYRAKNGSYPKDLGVLNLSLGLYHLIDSWLVKLMGRRHKNVATVAVANKNARTVWALLMHDRTYQADYQRA